MAAEQLRKSLGQLKNARKIKSLADGLKSKKQKLDKHVEEQQIHEVISSLPDISESSTSWGRRRTTDYNAWEYIRPALFQSFIERHNILGMCQTTNCIEPAVARCHDGCGQYCPECDYAVHFKKPLHQRLCMVRQLCSGDCGSTADMRCEECLDFFCEECHPVSGHVFITEERDYIKTLSGANFIDNRGTIVQKDAFLSISLAKCENCQTDLNIQKQVECKVITCKGNVDQIFLPKGFCEICGIQKQTTLEDIITMNLFPSKPNLVTGIVLYDMYLLDLVISLKNWAPNLSDRSIKMALENRAKLVNQDFPINETLFSDTLREYSFLKYEVHNVKDTNYTDCLACRDGLTACHTDGNRKLFRYKRSSILDRTTYTEGVFFEKRDVLDNFVKQVQRRKIEDSSQQCGASHWKAAKEKSTTFKHLDETGTVIACCRHNICYRGINMMQGEIYPYSLYIQHYMSQFNVKFFCQDVVCKYWPWKDKILEKTPQNDPLHNIAEHKPFLSVMHSKAHSWSCQVLWGGRNQKGSGLTTGEEMEQVHVTLSKKGVTTRHQSSARREEELTFFVLEKNLQKNENLPKTLLMRYIKNEKKIKQLEEQVTHLMTLLDCSNDTVNRWRGEIITMAQGQQNVAQLTEPQLKTSIEMLYVSIQRRQQMINKEGSTKARSYIVAKKKKETAQLKEAIERYNTNNANIITATHSKEGFWPWQTTMDAATLVNKKKMVDLSNDFMRATEEKDILTAEIDSICTHSKTKTLRYFQQFDWNKHGGKPNRYSYYTDNESLQIGIKGLQNEAFLQALKIYREACRTKVKCGSGIQFEYDKNDETDIESLEGNDHGGSDDEGSYIEDSD